MKLDLNNANGKAAEHYFAYWVLRYLNWPCRLLDVDIGIDAQIEIMDEAMHSTGEFLAAQIKTSINPELKISIKLEHLKYWESISDPVILVLVSFNDNEPKIYWKLVNKKDTRNKLHKEKEEKKKTVDVRFTQDDLLSPSSLSQLVRLPYKNELAILNKTYKKLYDLWLEVGEPCYSEEYDRYDYENYNNFDLITAHYFMENFNTACYLVDKIDDMTSKNNKLSELTSDVHSIYETYEEIKSVIISMLPDVMENDCYHDYEFRRAWSTSDKHKTIIKMVE
ncbi:DUF4365 domain-containing protein [Rheinheimera sp. 1928-s]|uniref:DUF4365 domain-containing protein n=1 Tax=Rheinheimera sp. 1928-s TaxID=3033803 RepID=UPI00263311F8|nr:DUF4365 domain-containing protein [Rheinheimera sp. 1928-s]MDF3123489.1 DUF4365 domain-containing protein [Rheinheimera sp. 1928-s]